MGKNTSNEHIERFLMSFMDGPLHDEYFTMYKYVQRHGELAHL